MLMWEGKVRGYANNAERCVVINMKRAGLLGPNVLFPSKNSFVLISLSPLDRQGITIQLKL